MQEYKNIEEYRAGKHDFKKPFIITDVATLKEEESKTGREGQLCLVHSRDWAYRSSCIPQAWTHTLDETA